MSNAIRVTLLVLPVLASALAQTLLGDSTGTVPDTIILNTPALTSVTSPPANITFQGIATIP